MKSITKLSISFFLFLFLLSCSDEYYLISNNYQIIEVSDELDSSIVNIINPYKNQLDKEMNMVICFTKSELKKGKPESKLGNFVCDLSLLKADGMADICIFNNGGLRNIIASGDITVRDIYKVMPFEKAMHEFARSNHKDLLDMINESLDYNDDVSAKMKSTLDDFKTNGVW